MGSHTTAIALVLAGSLGLGAGARAADSAGRAGAALRNTGAAVQGLVQPRKRVRLQAPRDGVLREVRAVEGAAVAAGDTLAMMDDAVQRARVEAARTATGADGDLRIARVALRKASDRLERVERGFEKQAASEWELREARMAVDEARAALDGAQERRAQDETRLAVEEAVLAEYTLLAPFDGVVTRVEFDEGASLSTADVVFEIVGLAELEAVLYLPASAFGTLETGQRYRLRGESPVDQTITAALETVDAFLDPASRTFRAVFVIDNADGRLPAGFHVALEDWSAVQSAANPSD